MKPILNLYSVEVTRKILKKGSHRGAPIRFRYFSELLAKQQCHCGSELVGFELVLNTNPTQWYLTPIVCTVDGQLRRCNWNDRPNWCSVCEQQLAIEVNELPIPILVTGRLRRLIHRQDNRCCWCGEEFSIGELRPTVEHIIPQSLGGSNGTDNIAAAHYRCNNGRGITPMIPLDFVQYSFPEPPVRLRRT